MARPTSEHPTQLELAILKILWRRSPQTTEEIRSALASEGRELAYSSVITIANIMARKGLVDRMKQGRAFAYQPLVAEDEVSRDMVTDLVDRLFDGSAAALMLRVLETTDVNTAELDEIRDLIQRKAQHQGENRS